MKASNSPLVTRMLVCACLMSEPGVGARSAGVLAKLVDEFFRQPVQVCPGELLLDAVVVLGCAIFEGANDCGDGVDSAESLIQGTVHRVHLPLSSWAILDELIWACLRPPGRAPVTEVSVAGPSPSKCAHPT